MKRQSRDEEQVSKAASLMGKQSWRAKLARHGLRKLKAQLSTMGKAAAGKSGRPRLPDNRVTPSALYQRERRARLKAEEKLRKGESE